MALRENSRPWRRTIASVGACALFGCMHSACFVVTDDGKTAPVVDTMPNDPAVEQGTLVLRWTVDGAADPAACRTNVVAVRVVTDANAFVSTHDEPCESFAKRVLLSPGRYRALVELRDVTGHALGPSVTTTSFTIAGSDEVKLVIDLTRQPAEE